MLETRSSPFAFGNVLTRSLNILENVKNNQALLREVLAHIRKHRESVSTVMKVLTQEETLKKHGKQKLLQMILAIWAAFPDMANPQKVIFYLSTMSEKKLVRILLLKTLIILIKRNKVDLGQALSCIEAHISKGCLETDYLVLTAMIEIVEHRPDLIEKEEIMQVKKKLPESIPISLIPSMMHLALKANFVYEVPMEMISINNTSAYIRILDTVSILAIRYPQNKLFSLIFSKITDDFRHKMAHFLQKMPIQPDYTIKNAKKIPFTNSLIIQRIKDILISEDAQAKKIEKLKKMLNFEV